MPHVLRLFERILAFESDDHSDGKVGIQAFHRAAASLGLELKDAADAFVRVAHSADDENGHVEDEESCQSSAMREKWEKRRFTAADLRRFLDESFARHAELFSSLEAIAHEMDLKVPDLESLSIDERTTFIGPLLGRRICITEAMRCCDALKLKLSHIQQNLHKHTSEIHRLEDQAFMRNEDEAAVPAELGAIAAPYGKANGLMKNSVSEAREHGTRENSPSVDAALQTMGAPNFKEPLQVMWGSLFENYHALKQLQDQTEKDRKRLTVLKTFTEDRYIVRIPQRNRIFTSGHKSRYSQKSWHSTDESPLTKDVEKERVQEQIFLVQDALNSSLTQLAAKKEEISIMESLIAQKSIAKSHQTSASQQSNQVPSGISLASAPSKQARPSKTNLHQRPVLGQNLPGPIECHNPGGHRENSVGLPSSSSNASILWNTDMKSMDAVLAATFPKPCRSISASSVAQDVLEQTRKMMDLPKSMRYSISPRRSTRKKMTRSQVMTNEKKDLQEPIISMDTAIRSAVNGALRSL
eukprot:GEMP01029773.1.p1 GENE.GEMP01029773.1~~GEMP01029773.1.p1  ORF type:complete len:526 (+),score=130.98 GEMP01029773.1:54-1631(+)